jgi:signal transduction histidine kinase/DNA-binding response OmpR family regulator
MHFGISQRILSALVLIALVLSIFFWLTLDRFSRFHTRFEQITHNELPALIIAANLEQEAGTLVAHIQDILMPAKGYQFADVKDLIEQSVNRTGDMILRLEQKRGFHKKIQDMSLQYQQLANNHLALLALKEQELVLTQQQEHLCNRLAVLKKELTNTVLFPPQQLAITAEPDLRDWHFAVLRSVALLAASYITRSQDQLEQYSLQLAQNMDVATKALNRLPPVTREYLIRYHREITSAGLGNNSLFFFRAELLQLQTRLDEHLVKGRKYASALLAASHRLHMEFTTITLMDNQEIEVKLQRFHVVLFFFAVMILLSLAAIYIFVRRSVISRIFRIQKELTENCVDGSYAIVPVQETGKDELTALAAGINYVLGKIHQREVQLKNAVKEAEAANDSKSVFIANVSHEIRTPMNAIINLTSLCLEAQLDSELDSKRKGWLQAVRRSSGLLLTLTDDILDLAKAEAGKLELSYAVFSLSDLLARLDPYRINAGLKGLDFTVTMGKKIPEYWNGDYQRIGQVLTNLVSNAIKFTKKGSVNVDIEMYGQEKEQWLLFRVSDTGIGIRDDQMERIFNPFQQADSFTSRIYGGTGLGLTISKQFVELMGGSIEVECNLEEGSSFQFILPLQPATAEHIDKSGAVGLRPGERIRHHFAGRAVLVVEDNPFNLMVAQELLGLVNIKPDIAGDGLEAMKTAQSKKYDLILMDLHMPRMDGMEAGLAIRNLPDYRELPIIMLTADAARETRQHCQRLGMNDVITKPIDPDEFYRVLERWLPEKLLERKRHCDEQQGKIGDRGKKKKEQQTKPVDATVLINNNFILKAFIEHHKEAVQHIRQALADRDYQEAHRRAHNLKSASGSVGAKLLKRQAEELEKIFTRALAEENHAAVSDPAVAELLDQVETELCEILEHVVRRLS